MRAYKFCGGKAGRRIRDQVTKASCVRPIRIGPKCIMVFGGEERDNFQVGEVVPAPLS
jgi:hypothetical protein